MKAIIGCALLAATLVMPASADLFVNGFLQPGPGQVGLPGATFVTLFAGQPIGDPSGAHWTVVNGGTNPADTNGSVDWIGGCTYWVPPDEGWIHTPFYGSELISQSVSALLFVGLCGYLWLRSVRRS
jgi:hypothetical protein